MHGRHFVDSSPAERAIWSYTHRIASGTHEPAQPEAAIGSEDVEAILSAHREIDIPTAARCLGLSVSHVRKLAAAGVLRVSKTRDRKTVTTRSVRDYRKTVKG